MFETYDRSRWELFWLHWKPLLFQVRRWYAQADLRIGGLAFVNVRVQAKCYSQGPGAEISAGLWRVRATAWIGGLWISDEDGEARSLAGVHFTFVTYDFMRRWVCRPFGHKPKNLGTKRKPWLFCDRCGEEI